MMDISTQADFRISEALALGGPARELADVVDLKYAGEGSGLILRVCDETLGFGTREAGRELRRKVKNLLNAAPGKGIVLDWSRVPLVASSFADEAVGKLFVELGPTAFSGRVTHVGAEPLVQSLLDRAVMQRVAQEMSGGDAAGP